MSEALRQRRPEGDLLDRLWLDLDAGVRRADGAAAQAHLDAGWPIYYAEDDTLAGLLVKEHPDGLRELVKFDEAGDQVIRTL